MKRMLALSTVVALMALGAPTVNAAVKTCFGKAATIVGTPGDDTIYGTPGSDVIVGLSGFDEISAGDGNDYICGGAGGGYLVGQDGNDHIVGGAVIGLHNDGTGIPDEAGDDVLIGGWDTVDVIFGDSGNDVIDLRTNLHPQNSNGGYEQAFGGEGDDHITSEAGGQFYGGPGNDTINGSDYHDKILGEAGADLIYGRGGLWYGPTGATFGDHLVGGQGADRIYGQSDSDDIWGADIRQDVGPGVPARDNDVDIVDGGTATDSCRVDSLDIVSNCEELPSYYF